MLTCDWISFDTGHVLLFGVAVESPHEPAVISVSFNVNNCKQTCAKFERSLIRLSIHLEDWPPQEVIEAEENLFLMELMAGDSLSLSSSEIHVDVTGL